MTDRKTLVKELKTLLDGMFIYGSYKSEPTKIPYGNYGEDEAHYIYADDKVFLKRRRYIIRVVTTHKDFELEENVESIFDRLEIPYRKITDQEVLEQNVYVFEWLVDLLN